MKVKYFKKYKSYKHQRSQHKSPEGAERFETKTVKISESMQEQLNDKKRTEQLRIKKYNKEKQENNSENASCILTIKRNRKTIVRMLHAFSQLEKKLFLRNSCENAYQINGIADHAQKAESSENLAENQLLKSGLKEFEGKRTTLE